MSEVNRTQAPQGAGPLPASGPSNTGSGTGGAGNFSSSVTIFHPGAELAKLVVGQRIDATVLRSDEAGLTRLLLNNTQVSVHLNPPPAKGTVVRFQVASVTPAVSLQLLDTALAIRPNGNIIGQQPATSALPRIAPGQVLQAHFSNEGPARLAPTGHPLMSAKSPVKAYVANAVTTSTTPPASSLLADGPVAIRVLAIHTGIAKQASTAVQLTNPAEPKGQIVTGELSTSSTGRPSIETPVGRFTLDRPPGLPEGTRIQVQVNPLGPRPGIMTGANVTPVMTTTHFWDDFQTALQQVVANPAAPQAVAQATPQAGPRLTTTVVFLLSALSGGRLQDWLGRESLETLQREQPQLLGRLTEAFTQLSQNSRESIQGDWRLLYLPFLSDQWLSPLRLFLRNQHEDGSAGGKQHNQGTRFVLEAELSRLGLFQLDGFVRDRNFDLTIHTTQQLAENHRTAIKQIFSKAGEAANFSGRLEFVASPVVLHESNPTAPATHNGVLA